MNYFVRKFIIENYQEENSVTDNLLLTYCISKFDSEKRISDSIIDSLPKFFEKYFSKNEIIPSEEIKERIITFKNANQIQAKEIQIKPNNRFIGEYIKSIQVSNFKGFYSVSEEDLGVRINLHKKKNIFYGVNGSGKTSFCEALEYKLTGSIKEAKRRGLKEKEYFKRNEKGTEKIKLEFKSIREDLDRLTDFEVNEFNKCFIEKNRITEFALLRGYKETGVKSKDVTARLLGFEVFDNFKSKFVQHSSFKKKAEDKKKYNAFKELESQKINNRIQSERYNKTITDINDLNIDKSEIENLQFSIWNLKLLKDKLRRLELKEFKSKDVKRWFWRLYLNIQRLNKLELQIKEQSANINFKQLYEAVINIGNSEDSNSCPACKTSIENVIVNPFENSKVELQKLHKLDSIQKLKNRLDNTLVNVFWNELISFVQNCKVAKTSNLGLKISEIEGFKTFDEKIKLLKHLFENNDRELLKYLENYSNEYAKNYKFDSLYKRVSDLIKEKESKLELFNSKELKFKLIKEDQKEYYKNKLISEDKSKKLNIKIQVEKEFANFIDNVISSYDGLIKKLESFLLKEQNNLIVKIKGRILEYYNEINRGDSEDEVIKDIQFNQRNDKTYSIDLKRNDGIKNAGVVLSEGHLRSLGLSIILSIAESSNVPFIVFDDVVNAIDSEHRANIINMMFVNSFLKKTQLIVTTHDRLFWERFCNVYSSKINKKELSLISFCFKYQNQGISYIPYNISYEEKIKEALIYSDIRQALVYLRIWFETVCFGYCKKSDKIVTGKFSKDPVDKPTHLIVSLNKVYDTIITKSFPRSDNLKIIKEKLNWRFLNQEHHSFDENIFNVTHSTTSKEIEDIFDAVKGFEQEVTHSLKYNEHL